MLPAGGLGFPVHHSSSAGASGPSSRPSRAWLPSSILTSPVGVKPQSPSGERSASHGNWPAAITATTSYSQSLVELGLWNRQLVELER